eukprot:5210584-Prymnesium_polylepis.2
MVIAANPPSAVWEKPKCADVCCEINVSYGVSATRPTMDTVFFWFAAWPPTAASPSCRSRPEMATIDAVVCPPSSLRWSSPSLLQHAVVSEPTSIPKHDIDPSIL